MRILITTASPSLDANVDPRFGRGAFFLVVDTDTLLWQAESNAGANAAGGAGSVAAQFAANKKVAAVISGDFGPNAYSALNAAGLPMYLLGTAKTAREAVALFKAGKLERVGAPTGPGHHGGRG
jgi:predicted Fe-Mo cluster-binding NifX family protein